jgi:hypothetical protein
MSLNIVINLGVIPVWSGVTIDAKIRYKRHRPKLPLVRALRRLQSPIEKPTIWKKFCFHFPKNVASEALRLDIGP